MTIQAMFSYSLAGIIILLAATVPCYGNPVPQVWCVFNSTTGQLTANMFIFKNGSDINHVNYAHYYPNGTIDTIDDADCQWTGTGEDDDPYMSVGIFNYQTESDFGTSSSCGAFVEEPGELYAWYVYGQFLPPYVTKGDVIVHFRCNESHNLPEELSIYVEPVEIYDMETPLDPASGLISLEVISSQNGNPISSIDIGDLFNLRLSFQPDNKNRPETDANLTVWGVYCKELYAQSSDGSRRTILLDPNACPTSDEFLQLPEGFQANEPDENNRFTALAGPIVAARYDKPATAAVVFICHIELCIRSTDTTCYDPCQVLSNRKKRSIVPRVVTTTLYVTDTVSEGPEKKTAVPMYVWIIIGVGVALALAITIIGTVCAMRRMRSSKYKRQSNSSHASSDSVYANKPYYY